MLLILLLLAGAIGAPAGAPPKPKLVVAIVIDQFRYDYLSRFRADYGSGLAYLLQHGAVFSNAHYLHAYTVTAVGHATFLTGATPSTSGIVGNDWYDRESGKMVSSVSDPATTLIGGAPSATGSSPHRLLVSTVGDELKMRGGDSKVVGVSIKDRAAILPAGHMADAAYWYDPATEHWVTSSYYRPDLPDWVVKLNGEKTYQRYSSAEWRPFDAPAGKPFCTMVAGTAVRYCRSLEATPWANEMIEDFAERAIQNENLGRHQGTDILTVSFSANDYVGHAVGPDDPAVRDISVRTDRLLGKLSAFVNQRVGAGNTLFILAADHGVAPVPEVNRARHMPGGRISAARFTARIADALTKRFGAGKWLLTSSPSMPYLNLDLVQSMNLDPAEVERVAAAAARTEPHVARVYTWHELHNGEVQQDAIGRALSLGFYGPRSGSLLVLAEPYYLFEATGTSHGTPYEYDSHVPVIFCGAGIKPGTYRQPIAVNDVAATLSAILGVESPSGSIGRVLSDIFE